MSNRKYVPIDEYEAIENRVRQLEDAIRMQPVGSHGYIVGSPEDKMRTYPVGATVYAILQHLGMYPEIEVRQETFHLRKR